MEKVKITQQQADVLETMKAKGATLNEIVERQVHRDYIKVSGYENVAKLSVDTLIRVLYIGYEIEETPEDEVREIYYRYLAPYNGIGASAIRDCLDALNITIKGVNEHE